MKKIYHLTFLEYLPEILKEKALKPTIKSKTQVIERVYRYYLKRGMKKEEISKNLNELLKKENEYIREEHKFLWISTSLKDVLSKYKKISIRIKST